MPSPLLYSTNPWVAHDIAVRYLSGVHFAWVSEFFDAATAVRGSAAAAIAPSSNPYRIYRRLHEDVKHEDRHSALISGYKKTFKRLAGTWKSTGVINESQRQEIISVIQSPSWRIWRPILYVIPREGIQPNDRIRLVEHGKRAAYGPEMQIADLTTSEFDIVELHYD